MFKNEGSIIAGILIIGVLGFLCSPTEAAVRIEGQVQAGGGPVANSAVTLWAASGDQPRQLAQTRTNDGGRFEISSQETPGPDISLYVVAKGGEGSRGEQERWRQSGDRTVIGAGQSWSSAARAVSQECGLVATFNEFSAPAVMWSQLADQIAWGIKGATHDDNQRASHPVGLSASTGGLQQR
jgi:hypothetical protein